MSFLWIAYLMCTIAMVLAWRNGSWKHFIYLFGAMLSAVFAQDYVVNSLYLILVGLPLVILVCLYARAGLLFGSYSGETTDNTKEV